MAPESAPKLRFDASVLDQLGCPACFGALRAEADRILCAGCGRVYPIIDGIPVLIPDRATDRAVNRATDRTVPAQE